MEIFGIVFSIPAALIASTIYIILLGWIIGELPQFKTLFPAGSYPILELFLVESLVLVTLDAVKVSALVGLAFHELHLAVFFLGVPDLANVLVLQKHMTTRLAVALCTLFAFILV